MISLCDSGTHAGPILPNLLSAESAVSGDNHHRFQIANRPKETGMTSELQ